MKKLAFLFIMFLSVFTYSQYSYAQARQFDGSDDTILVPHSDSLMPYRNQTLEAWIFLTDIGYEVCDIVTKGANSIDGHTGVRFEKYRPDPEYLGSIAYVANYNDYAIAPFNMKGYMGVWFHFAGTFDGSTMKMYLNGKLLGSVGKTGTATSDADFVIGKGQYGGEFYVDELRLWNYAKTQEQIISGMDKVLGDEEEGLMAYWNFDELTDGIYDSTENNNDSTEITGTTSVDNAPIKRIVGK